VQRAPLFTIALLIALAITALWWQLAEKRARFEWRRAETADAHARALEDSLRARSLLAPGRSSAATTARGIGPEQLAALRARGLTDPVRQIPASLADHPELIPYPGALGGTMGFHDRAGIVLLDGPWVLAPFDDGHVEGRGLFEYQVAPGGYIHWKRVAARVD
jgi:hypothetical protein